MKNLQKKLDAARKKRDALLIKLMKSTGWSTPDELQKLTCMDLKVRALEQQQD